MQLLPHHPNLEHLKKQAKDLLRLYRAGDSDAIARFARSLPSARNRRPENTSAQPLRLHDAQSCIAREYGFLSWADLADHVEALRLRQDEPTVRLSRWLAVVYGGDVAGHSGLARPHLAARILHENPGLASDDPYVACAIGDEAILRQATAVDPAWLNRPGGPLKLPPLVAVAHSHLAQLPEFQERLYRSARYLLEAGADANQKIFNRHPGASLGAPGENAPLSALYGAAGINRDPALTTLLLDAGADPNDGESLYHSLENPECTRLLLLHGAHVAGTNALRRSLDMAHAEALELLLAHGGDANEPASGPPTSDWGAPLLRAIALRRSPRHIEALLGAGADASARTPGGIGAYRLALQVGMPDVADVLSRAGAAEPLSLDEQFVAACARADAAEARRIKALRPDLPGSLQEAQLRVLPDTIAWGSSDAAVRVMVELGWPIATPGGDWGASALNQAVFNGNADLAAFLLAHGASWQEKHGYDSDVIGTLSWASVNEPVADGDLVACTRALLAHGMPAAQRDPDNPELVLIAGRKAQFSEEIANILLEAG
ncbi:ankyrin repeat domain-containing protein [Paraburkholderia megapolitana]|uniref:Ankyrin repeat n=1 Tax=Paraburkholderia megapolitana TaxID=420953 RepID=A0A1I3EFV3_9BURK|nr:hypothetical protein [Paraburkholderia megapolitana]QDQ80055.1 hypothetical protein FNZ07_02115 [Paraburkholderia megapolitana]SFH97743.1 hypothetical protein SAMN05192543_101846 [Paraburkholderia megapolitana]